MRELAAPGFEEHWRLVSRIQGWLSKEQAAALNAAAQQVAPGAAVVEIGSHNGRSTVALATGMRQGVRLLAVDPFPDRAIYRGEEVLAELRRNLDLAGVAEKVEVFRGTSEDAAAHTDEIRRLVTDAVAHAPDTGWIGLLFVDGLHDRQSVKADIAHWESSLAPGGLIFFHDAFFRRGVTLAVLERYLFNSAFHYLGSVSNLVMFRHERCDRSLTVANSLRLLMRLAYYVRNLVTKLALRRRWSVILQIVPPESDFEY